MASLAKATAPACDGLVCKLGEPDRVAAAWIDGNPLHPTWVATVETPSSRLWCWSGTLAEEPFAIHPPNWMSPGRSSLDAFVQAATTTLRNSAQALCLRPHHRHVLSDVPGCMRLLRENAGIGLHISLAPADLISPDMVKDLPDHLERIFSTLGPRAAIVLLQDLGPIDQHNLLAPVALGDGILPRDQVLQLIKDHVPAETPIVVMPQRLPEQLAWLGCKV